MLKSARPLILIAAALLVTVLGTLLTQRATTQAPDFEVRLLTFTNRPSGPTAMFLFTNATRRAVHFQTTSLQTKNAGDWEHVQTSPTNRIVGSLSAGKAFLLPMDVQDTNKPWRVRVSCVEQASGFPRLAEIASELFYRVRTGTPTHTYSGKSYSITSSPGDTNAE